MRNKTILTTLIILICFITSAQATQIWIAPAYREVPEGAYFTVDIMVDPEGTEVMGAEYKISFGNALLNATDQSKGTFLSHDGASTLNMPNKINNTIGIIEYGEFRMGVKHGVTNPGVLASVTFNVTGEHGVCELNLFDVVLSDRNATEIPDVNVISGSVKIVSGICGDVTGDGVVDTGDVILLSNYVGYPGYELNCT